jgi:hypothetical protein
MADRLEKLNSLGPFWAAFTRALSGVAGTLFPAPKVEKILEKIENLEKVKEISELNSLLVLK